MVKTIALILVVLLLAIMVLGFLHSPGILFIIDGHVVEGPLGTLIDVWGVALAGVILFCVGILLTFVFAGVGLLVLGVLALVGMVLLGTSLPFLLPILIPLLIVLIFAAGVRRGKKAASQNDSAKHVDTSAVGKEDG